MDNIEVKDTKFCKKCGFEKDFTEFYKCKSQKDGLTFYCKSHIQESKAEWKKKNPEKYRESNAKYREENRENIRTKNKAIYHKDIEKSREKGKNKKKNPEKTRVNAKKYRENNPDKIKQRWNRWYLQNKESYLDKQKKEYWKNHEESKRRGRESSQRTKKQRAEYKKIYRSNPEIKARESANGKQWKMENREEINIQKKEKYHTDKKNNLEIKISSAIKQSLKTSKGGRKWEDLVGYSLNELKLELESKFKNGMNWEKVLNAEIEIDHILPLELFEYESPEDIQFKICWSLNNLQPLWKDDNSAKSDFIEDGRRARYMTKDEKLQYLKNKGYNFYVS